MACASGRWRTCWPMRSRRRAPRARQRGLQRLGDVSLFIAGFFARSFARKLIDIDYHIAMGGNAYSSLADTLQRSASGRCVAAIYAQLAQKFQGLVDALE